MLWFPALVVLSVLRAMLSQEALLLLQLKYN